MENPTLVLLAILAFGALLTIFVLVIVYFAMQGLGSFSGWPRLLQRYPATYPPTTPPRLLWAIRVGPVRYRRCVSYAVEPEGLYLAAAGVFKRNKPLRIPWPEIKGVSESFFYWRRAMTLSIGDPTVGTVTVFPDVYEQLKGYLRV